MKSYEHLYGEEITVKLLVFTVKILNLLPGSTIFALLSSLNREQKKGMLGSH